MPNESARPDVMDVFASIDDIDKSHEAGLQEGERDGTVTGFAEGFCFGWKKGWEIGMEIGFYKGYSRRARDHYSSLHKASADSSPSRKVHPLNQFLELLERISLDNVKADNLSDDIILARRRFKQIFPGVFKSKGDTEASTTF